MSSGIHDASSKHFPGPEQEINSQDTRTVHDVRLQHTIPTYKFANRVHWHEYLRINEGGSLMNSYHVLLSLCYRFFDNGPLYDSNWGTKTKRDPFNSFKSLLFRPLSIPGDHAGKFPPGKVRHQLQSHILRTLEALTLPFSQSSRCAWIIFGSLLCS